MEKMNLELVEGGETVFFYDKAGMPKPTRTDETLISISVEEKGMNKIHHCFMKRTFRGRRDLAEACMEQLNKGFTPDEVENWFWKVNKKSTKKEV